MSQPMTLLELHDAIAKAIADAIGHGMREKCERHADEVLKVVAPQLLATADDATLRQAARVDEDNPFGSREKEAVQLAGILDGMTEGSYTLETLYEYDQGDGDPFVARAADLLREFSALEAALSAQPATVRCEPCGGMGNIMDMRCIGCDGTGRVSAQPAQGERPKHGDTHEDCGGQWCDYVQPEYKPSAARSFSPGESSIARYVRIGMICDKCGKEHPAAPVGVPDDAELLEIARRVGLRSTMHAVSASDARPLLRLFVQQVLAAAPSAPQESDDEPEAATVECPKCGGVGGWGRLYGGPSHHPTTECPDCKGAGNILAPSAPQGVER